MASKFAIGDKVDQAFSNHAEGTIVAIFTDRTGDHDMQLNCSVTEQYRLRARKFNRSRPCRSLIERPIRRGSRR
jgi:hypothetical protein